VQEATHVVDEQLLEAVSLVAKSSISIAQLSIGEDIDIIRRVTSHHIIGGETEALHVSPIVSQHFAEGPISIEVAAGRLPNFSSPTIILGFTRMQSCHTVTPPITSFCPRPGAQGIIVTVIRVMGFEYLTIQGIF